MLAIIHFCTLDFKEDEVMKHTIAVLGFIGTLTCVGTISACLPQNGFSLSENRYLQKKPKLEWESFLDGSFHIDYESYLSDQFPLRDAWVLVQSKAEQFLGKSDANGVYFGKDGYLIEKFESEDLLGSQLETNLERLSGSAERMVERLGKDHVRVLLASGAATMIPEKLPAFAAPYDENKLIEMLKEHMETPEIVLSLETCDYYKTDHHWTTKGAYEGYVTWANSVGIEPWSEDDFLLEIVSDSFYGTLYSKVQQAQQADEIVLYHPKEAKNYQVQYDETGVVHNSLYTYESLETRDQYTIFLDGNHGVTRITSDIKNGKTLLMVKDSYANSFAPFVANHYEEVIMIDLRFFNMKIDDFAEKEEITDVLYLYRTTGLSQEKTIMKL